MWDAGDLSASLDAPVQQHKDHIPFCLLIPSLFFFFFLNSSGMLRFLTTLHDFSAGMKPARSPVLSSLVWANYLTLLTDLWLLSLFIHSMMEINSIIPLKLRWSGVVIKPHHFEIIAKFAQLYSLELTTLVTEFLTVKSVNSFQA